MSVGVCVYVVGAWPEMFLTFQPVYKLLVLVSLGGGHGGTLVRDIQHCVPDCLVLGIGQVGHELVQLCGELIV